MTEKAELSLLLDYYSSFLTERQRELMRLSADEDMSLKEIADEVGVSRQGVRDCLSKASAQLTECESKLGLIAKDKELRSILALLKSAGGSDSAEDVKAAVDSAVSRIRALIK